MTEADLIALMEGTWPAAETLQRGPWLLRRGLGGGKRVSAATALTGWTDESIPEAEAGMQTLGQTPLFMIRSEDSLLDQALQSRGYRVVDPVVAYSAPCSHVGSEPVAPMSAFAHWPPLAICTELWADGGIGPERVAIMSRAAGPKAAILARADDRPVGVAFVAVHAGAAMVHALYVCPRARRRGSAHNMMRLAAGWSLAQGASTLSVVVTVANTAARNLYASLSMEDVGHYHYRQK